MAFRVFAIPTIGDDGRAAEELNAFLRRVRVLRATPCRCGDNWRSEAASTLKEAPCAAVQLSL